eukprot:NODE_4568_length_661_cov_176.679868.p1 GENE.NODE_4568_length_661_cov_176.679868~~NODE_4568_length_661_cov_176.679868.p1  ORF type:complete len:104 (-),score=27.13 NODE_4568_length_661_cov_176.679868:247-558(-)
MEAAAERLRGATDEEQQRAAAQDLASLGKDSLPYLVELLRDPNPRVRVSSVLAIGTIGTPAAACTRELAALLRDPYTEVRDAVRWAVGQVYTDEKEEEVAASN